MRASVHDVLMFTITIGLILTLPIGFSVSQDIVLERTQPVDGVPCAGQTVIYNCRVVGSGEQSWSLPNGESQDLRFTAGSANGTVRPSVDGNFIATLTSRTGMDPDFIFDSTLMIKEAMNYSMNLTCTASGGVSDTTMIVVSGIPNTPSDPGYVDTTIIEDSVNLRWTRPSYTGGVALDHYTVTANDETRMVENDMETVQFSPGLVYGDVLITAINNCGQESEPAVINIPAAAPPDVSSISAQFSCEDISSPWSVGWMNETRENGVVYPDVEVVVKANGTEICPDVTAAVTSCTPNTPRGLYNISIT